MVFFQIIFSKNAIEQQTIRCYKSVQPLLEKMLKTSRRLTEKAGIKEGCIFYS